MSILNIYALKVTLTTFFFRYKNWPFFFIIEPEIPGKNHWFDVKKIIPKSRSGPAGPFANTAKFIGFSAGSDLFFQWNRVKIHGISTGNFSFSAM